MKFWASGEFNLYCAVCSLILGKALKGRSVEGFQYCPPALLLLEGN